MIGDGDKVEVSNIDLIKQMTRKYKIPFKYSKFIHHHKSVFMERFNKYSLNDKLNMNRILIIGCGPAGLRTAINLSCLGYKDIKLIDSRDYFNRKQIVAIWNITESDLISFGIRDLLPKFTKSGDKKSIPITYLQHFLLRVALLLNCKIETNLQFKNIDIKNKKLLIINKNKNDEIEEWDNDYDILIDASGTRASLRDSPINSISNQIENDNDEETKEEKAEIEYVIGPKMSSHKKNDIFGVTANFNRVKKDHLIEQILGKASYLFQDEFKSKKIRLENIVYYRSTLSNYMVATVKKQSLKQENIFKNHKLKGKSLLNRDNINMDNLRDMILLIAQEWNIPYNKKKDKNPFNKLRGDRDDFALFEFGNLKQAKQPIKFIKIDDNKHCMIACIGDSCAAPFWPKGTGVNHAFIGQYLITHIINKWCNVDIDKKYNIKFMNDIESNAKQDFDVLNQDLSDKQWHKERIGIKYMKDWQCPSDFAGYKTVAYSQRADVQEYYKKHSTK